MNHFGRDSVDDRDTMFNLLEFVGRKTVRGAGAGLALCAVLLTGCAGGITNASQYSAQSQIRPDEIYVYSFVSTPDQVKLDSSGLV